MVVPYIENHRSGACGNPEKKTNAILEGMVLLTGLSGYGKTKLLGYLEKSVQLGKVIYVDFLSLDQHDYPVPQGFVNYFQTILKDNPIMILIDHPWAYDAYMDAIDEHIIKPYLYSGGKVVVACRRREDNPFSTPYQEIKLTPWTVSGRDEYCEHRVGSLEVQQYQGLYGSLDLHIPCLVANGLDFGKLEEYFQNVFESFIDMNSFEKVLPYLAVVSCVEEPSDVNKMLEYIQKVEENRMDVEMFRSTLRNSGVIQGGWDAKGEYFSFSWNEPLQRSLQVWLKITNPSMYSEIMKKGV